MGTLEIFSVTSQALEILDLPTEESVAPPVTEGNITGVSTLGVTPAPSTLHPGVHDPLPFQPTSVADLMREMPVYKLTFSNSTAVGTATSFAPLHALLAALASPLLYQYDLLRYKAIKLRLTPVGCTPSLNGAIRLSGQPFDCFSGSVLVDDYRHSTVENIIVPFSHAKEICMSIPWLYPRNGLQTSALHTAMISPYVSATDNVPRFTSTLASILYNTSLTACSVNYVIYAQFEGLELSMYNGGSLSAPTSYPGYLAMTNSVWTLDTTHSYGKGDREAQKKSETGVISGIAGSVKHIADSVESLVPNPISPVVSTIAGVVGSIAQFFGFDKPANVDATTHVEPRFGDDMLPIGGLDSSVKMNVAQDVIDDFDPSIMGASKNDASVAQYASRFAVVGNLTDPGTSTYPVVLGSIPVNCNNQFVNAAGTVIHKPPLSMAASFFNKWRGDIRFRVHCHMDMFSTAQLVFMVTSSTFSGSINTINVPRETRNVSGSTVIEFTVPYINWKDWMQIGPTTSDYNFVLTIGLNDAVRRQGVATPGYFIVEMAGPEDASRIQFAEPRLMAISHGRNFLDLPSLPLGHNRNSAITPVPSFIDLFKRYTWYTSTGINVSVLPVPFTVTTNLISLMMSMFRHFRGSVRYRMFMANYEDAVIGLSPENSENDYGNTTSLQGVVPRQGQINPSLGIELHYDSADYYGIYPLAVTEYYYGEPQLQWRYYGTNVPTRDLYIALGDDFFVACPMATPLIPISSGFFDVSKLVAKAVASKALKTIDTPPAYPAVNSPPSSAPFSTEKFKPAPSSSSGAFF